jgi:adenylate kinase
VRLLLVASPGAGKGTQAVRLAAHYSIVHLSSGDLLRKEVAAGTRIGQIAADYLRRGDLVPDELVIEMLVTPILEAVKAGGYVLDGFPRTLRQAEEAYQVATQVDGIELQAVIHLEVSPEELNRRLLARAEDDGRNDDTQATIAHRLEVFDAETKPLLGFYAERGLLIKVNGEQTIDRVFADIVTAVDRLLPPAKESPTASQLR